MSNVKYFTPNDKMHKELGDALRTAKANGVDPYKYLTYVFRQMPGSDFKKHPEILEHMMPWDSKIQELCKNTL